MKHIKLFEQHCCFSGKKNDIKLLKETAVSEGMGYHLQNGTPISESVYRFGSRKHFELVQEARELLSKGYLRVSEEDEEFLSTDFGKTATFEEEEVLLDFPLVEAEYKGKDVELNVPRRGGPKKYYVYVKNPDSGNVIRITFGDKNLSAKVNDPAAVRSFVARHKCKEKNDKTKAGYWACRLPRYKSLGFDGNIKWW